MGGERVIFSLSKFPNPITRVQQLLFHSCSDLPGYVGYRAYDTGDERKELNSPVTKRVEVCAPNPTAKHACIVWLDRMAVFTEIVVFCSAKRT